ncbi:MAG: MoxR family ATPase [Candidatus Altiarchaeota archaeon]
MKEVSEQELYKHSQKLQDMREEIKKGIIGQERVVDLVLKCMICRGHILLESVPGLAKTLLVRILTRTVKASSFQRIQFTPDLLPSDITGTSVYEEAKGFYILKGPIFANFILADEINRSPPKVQSAMLEAMGERQVTIAKESFDLPNPFMVLATQNPLEQSGVYPLSVAQTDRFLFKIFVDYPTEEEELEIIDHNAEVKKVRDLDVKSVISHQDILDLQSVIKRVHLSPEVKSYAIDLVDATRNPAKYNIKNANFIHWGASPRASIYLTLGARATALMQGRVYTMPEDVRAVAKPVLRHRILLNYEGKAREVRTDDVVDEIIKKVPVL